MQVFLSCVAEKENHKCKAKDMYISALFKKAYKYAKDILKADKIYILSAKYHLLSLNDEIEPYNLTLNDFSAEEKEKWGKKVYQKMKEKHINFDEETYFLAGDNYTESIKEYFTNYKEPYKRPSIEGIGDILHWLTKQVGESLTEYFKNILND